MRLLRPGRANVRLRALVAGAECYVVRPGLFQAEGTVRTTAHDCRIMVILRVVLPEAHGANIERATLGQSCIPAARTSEEPSRLRPSYDRVLAKLAAVALKPLMPLLTLLRGWIRIVRHRHG